MRRWPDRRPRRRRTARGRSDTVPPLTARQCSTRPTAGTPKLRERLDGDRRVEPAERRGLTLADRAEQRRRHVDARRAPAHARGRAARAADRPDDAGGHAQRRARAQRSRQPRDRPGAERPASDVTVHSAASCPRARHDAIVRLALGAEKPEHGGHRRQPDAAVAQPLGVQPVLVELEPLRQHARRWPGAGTPPADDRSRLCHDEAPMSRSTTAAAILAGGQARRFGGRDKSRLVVEGRPIIVRQVEVLQRVAHDIFIVGPRAGPVCGPRPARPRRPDARPRARWADSTRRSKSPGATRVLVVACDLPFLDAGLLARLVERAAGATAPGCARRAASSRCSPATGVGARTRVLERHRRRAR